MTPIIWDQVKVIIDGSFYQGYGFVVVAKKSEIFNEKIWFLPSGRNKIGEKLYALCTGIDKLRNFL